MEDVYILIDCSWSMKDMKDDVIREVNEYILGKGRATRFSVYFFNHDIDRPIIQKREVYISDDMYDIWGRSALYDSIDITIKDATSRSKIPPTFVVYTDGIDTASIYCTKSQIEDMIDHYKSIGCKFEFLRKNPFKNRNSRCCSLRSLGFR
jgi:hypothetical protein